ncbi:hypothetical protein D3C83_309780 [compost metagenome]
MAQAAIASAKMSVPGVPLEKATIARRPDSKTRARSNQGDVFRRFVLRIPFSIGRANKNASGAGTTTSP